MNNFLMLVLTSLPNDIQGFWDMEYFRIHDSRGGCHAYW